MLSILSKLAIFIVCIFASFSHLNASDYPTALIKALELGDSPQKIRCLINKGEDVNEAYSEMLRALKPPLRYALDRVHNKESIEIIKVLINAGADVNALTYNRVEDSNLYGMMPLLSYSVIYSSPEAVQILIDSGAEVNFKLSKTSLNSNKTALTYARELGKKDMVEMLQKAGAE